jgi:membrane protein required for colicin V production
VNRIDLVLAIVLVLFALRGFWRGFSREFFGFIGLIGGLAVAAASYADGVRHVPAVVPENLRPIAAFAAIFLLVDLAAHLIGSLVHRLFGVLFLSPVNRLAGAVFGVVKGAAMSAIALLLVRAYTPVPAFMGELERSQLARPLLGIAGQLGRDARSDHAAPQGAESPRQEI